MIDEIVDVLSPQGESTILDNWYNDTTVHLHHGNRGFNILHVHFHIKIPGEAIGVG